MTTRIGHRIRKGKQKEIVERPLFIAACKAAGLPEPVTEWAFAKALRSRGWKFDYAWPELRVALEVEGGGWIGGRHNSGMGSLEDMEKYNTAIELGWFVVKCVHGAKDTVRYRDPKKDGTRSIAFTAPALLNPNTLTIIKNAMLARKSPPPVTGASQRSLL